MLAAGLPVSLKMEKPGGFLVAIIFFFFVPVVFAFVSGHDWQRVAQILIALFSFCSLARHVTRNGCGALLSASLQRLGLVAAFLALLSALRAHQPMWAFVEVALALSCCCIAAAIALERKRLGMAFDQIFVSFTIILCTVKSVQFASALVAVFLSGVDILDTTLLFDVFSNPRTYGQFQTFTLPLLAIPLLQTSIRPFVKTWVFALLSFWWMIAICGGTRGTWLGMAVAVVAVSCIGPAGRRWGASQLIAAALGCVLYWILFSVLPSWFDVRTLHFAADRLNTNLSAREVIWVQAWDMIKAKPFLGFGPMQFADIPNYVAAHPHQSILQWASEWGVPSAVVIGGVSLNGLMATVMLMRKQVASTEQESVVRIGVFASLMGGLAQSMVDGVIVMPYSQLWLCVIVGWLVGLHEYRRVPAPVAPAILKSGLLVMGSSVVFLGYIALRDFPQLAEREHRYQQDFGGHFQPRFWMQGVIANRPD